MLWIARPAIGMALAASMTVSAYARPIEIATLGRAPLLGQSATPGELKSNIRKNEALLRRAGLSLGLTSEQYAQFRLALDVGKPNWVVIPRHLDAMTWSAGGDIHVLRDVIIPANQKGLEVDLRSGDRILSVFVPAVCGNISLIRRSVPHVAKIRNFPVPHVAAVVPPAPTPSPAPVAVVPPPEYAPVATTVAPPPPIHHGFSLFPLAALLPLLFTGGSSTTPFTTPNVGTVVGPPPCP